jgi:hypothetical protein
LVFLTHQSVHVRKTLSVKVSRRFGAGSAVFDDDRLVSCAGLVPVMTLAEQTGLSRLIAEKVRIAEPRIASGAANPAPKLATVVAANRPDRRIATRGLAGLSGGLKSWCGCTTSSGHPDRS